MKTLYENKIKKGHFNKIVFIFLLIVLIALPLIGTVILTPLPVGAVPIIVSSPLPNGQVNVYYTATLIAYSVTGSATWEIPSGGGVLPPGLKLTKATGTISGTPTQAGTWPFLVTVKDSIDTSAPVSFYITIEPPPFSITNTSLPDGKEATAYNATLTATGGTTPYTWSIVLGNLPSGLLLGSTTGYISGIPAKGSAGTHSFTVQVQDSSSPRRTAQASFSIYIEKGSFQPTITIDSGLVAGSTKVKVDGKQVAVLKGGETFTFDLNLGVSRTITVDSIVDHPTDQNVRFKAKEDSLVVSETQPNVIFSYYTEYKIDVVTSPTQITTISGSGWYRKGSTTNIVTKTEVPKDNETKYVFSYWLLPDSTKISNDSLSYTVDAPGIITAYFDTYYKLTVVSPYGKVEGEGWYKQGTPVTWSLLNDEAPMEGIIGFFQGKYKALNSSGTEILDGPKTVTVIWDKDYTLPYILIPAVIIIFILAIIGFYFLLRRPQPRPVVYPPPVTPQPIAPRPIPQQHTTVVMIENKPEKLQQLPGSTTKEQLIEKFAQLLDAYESEIKSSMGMKGAPQIQTPTDMEKMISGSIPSPQAPQSDVVDAEIVHEVVTEERTCSFTAKKLLRTVAGKWKQVESSTVPLPPANESDTERIGLSVTWARDLYHEWEILTCKLLQNHKGRHKGETRIVYSLMNTVNIKQTYGHDEPVKPPSPHFTDSMPEIEPEEDEIVLASELPAENNP